MIAAAVVAPRLPPAAPAGVAVGARRRWGGAAGVADSVSVGTAPGARSGAVSAAAGGSVVDAPAPVRDFCVETFLPEGCAAGERIDGAFLVDSFYYMKKGKKKQASYFPRLLAQIRKESGLTMMAVCSGGAALSKPGDQGALFSELLERVPDDLQILIAVICGNDWYAQRNIRVLDTAVLEAGTSLCAAMSAKSECQLAIVGMSAATWSYEAWMSEEDAAQYDRNAAELAQHFLANGMWAVRGVEDLRGIVAADSIGHVSDESEGIVFEAYQRWVRLCMFCSGEAPSDGLPWERGADEGKPGAGSQDLELDIHRPVSDTNLPRAAQILEIFKEKTE